MSQDIQTRIDRIVELYLRGERPDAAVAKEFSDWLSADGHNDEKRRALETLFDRTVRYEAHPSLRTRRQFEKLARRLGFETPAPVRKPSRRGNYGILLRVAAVVVPLLVAVAVWWIYFRQCRVEQTDLRDFLADNTVVLTSSEDNVVIDHILPDGSVVSLNENSTIDYGTDFVEDRKIALSGESFFEVAEQEGDPFVVETEHLSITVTGTSFNVDSHPFDFTETISLYAGSLQVEFDETIYNLKAGQQLMFNKIDNIISITSFVADSEPEWLEDVSALELKATAYRLI